MDLSKIILIFGNIEGTPDVLGLSENVRFEYHPPEDSDEWRGKYPRCSEPEAPFLVLKSGENMFSPGGWVFGSDEDDKCDVQIARDRKTGVSRRHFRIDLSPDTHRPRLTNISRNLIRIYDTEGERGVSVITGQSLEILSAVTIDLGQVRMRAWRPALSIQEECQFRINAEDLSRQFLEARPRPSSSFNASGASTFNIRFGMNDTVYAREPSDLTSTGSHASVFKVKELRSGRVYAAKMPHFKAFDGASKARKRWESLTNEFRTIKDLKHPNIVQVIEVLEGSQSNDPPWLVMEWIPSDLSSITVEPNEIPLVLQDIASGLAYMHEKGRTHRDLKPANVLIERKETSLTAKIADFGTTKHDISGVMHTYTGSSIFMAPEFWEDAISYTKAVDMWSFGVLALTLLTEWAPTGWNSRFSPTKSEYRDWTDGTLLPRLDFAPATFKPFVQGLLCFEVEQRWTAERCLEWLQNQ